MAKPIKVLVSCGAGMATSTIIAEEVKETRGMKPRSRILLHWVGDRIALANRVENLLVHILEDRVVGGFLRDVNRLQNRNAGLNQGSKRTSRSRDDRLFNQVSKDRQTQEEQVPAEPHVAKARRQLDEKPDSKRNARNQVPVGHDHVGRFHEPLGKRGQLRVEVRKNFLKLRHDTRHDEDHDTARENENGDRVGHRGLNLRL